METNMYQAFISYRHKRLDIAAAKAIHTRLENYRIPSHIKKKSGLKKVGRCFRDRDELPTNSDLAQSIVDSLKSSNWLIAICTPDLPESKWCLSEIETFIELHGRSRVLAVLAAGEPHESFPEILRFETMPDGTRVEREPLAADIRSDTVPGMSRKLRTEKLRLLAPMLNVSFDDLRRRARERYIRIAAVVSLSVVLVLGGFLGYALNQNLLLEEQRNIAVANEARAIAGEAEALLQADIAQENEARAVVGEAEAKRQADIAQENEARAIVGEAEAKRQAGIALTNEELARENEARALLSETEARRQENIAKENEQLAIENESRAIVGEAEARRQTGIAKDNEALALAERDNVLISQSKFLASLSRDMVNSGDAARAKMLALAALPKALDNPDRPYVGEAEAALRDANLLSYPWFNTVAKPSEILDIKGIINYRLYEDVFVAVTAREIRMWDTVNGEAYPPLSIPLINGAANAVYLHKHNVTVRIHYGSSVEVYELQKDKTSILKLRKPVPLGGSEPLRSSILPSEDETNFFYYSYGSDEIYKQDYDKTDIANFTYSYDLFYEEVPIQRYWAYYSDEKAGTLDELPGMSLNIEYADRFDTYITAAVNDYADMTGTYTFNATTGEPLRKLNADLVRAFYGPNGNRFAITSDGVIEIIDVNTGELVSALSDEWVLDSLFSKVVKVLKFNDDETMVAFLTDNGGLYVYDAETGEMKVSIYSNNYLVHNVAWHGNYLIYTDSNNSITLIDPLGGHGTYGSMTYSLLAAMELKYSPISEQKFGIKYSGLSIIECSDDKTVIAILFDDNTGVQILRTENEAKAPYVILENSGWFNYSVSKTGRYIASGGGNYLNICDAVTGKRIRHAYIDKPDLDAYQIDVLQWLNGDESLIILKYDSYGRSPPFLLEYNIVADAYTVLHELPIHAFYARNEISGNWYAFYDNDEKAFMIYDLFTGRLLRSIPSSKEKHRFCRQRNGDIIAVYSFVGDEISIFNAETGIHKGNIKIKDGIAITYVTVSPNGQYIAAILGDYTFSVWKIDNGMLLSSIYTGGTLPIIPVWSDDGSYAAFRYSPDEIGIYSTASRSVVSTCIAGYEKISFCSDNSSMSAGSWIFDVKTGSPKFHMSIEDDFHSPALVWLGSDRVITRHDGNSSLVWDIQPLSSVKRQAEEELAGREFTELERRKFSIE